MPSPITALHEYLDDHQLWQKTVELRRGDHLHAAGEVHTNIYYVESGTMRSSVLVNDCEEQIIRFGYQGDFFAAIDSFVSGRPTQLYTQAIRRCQLQVIPRSLYTERIQQDPALNDIWQQILAWMIVGQLDREIDLLTSNPAERYRRVLARSPRLFQEIPAKYIANYLRMTPETLSRCRAR